MIDLVSAMTGLTNVPCTIGYSCDGATAGTANDGVNRWTSQANMAARWPNGSTTRLWMVLKFPSLGGSGSGAQVLITSPTTNTGTAAVSGSVVFSASAGFTGGSITTNPMATDQQILISSSNLEQGNNTNRAYRFSVVQSTDGLDTRVYCYSAGSLAFIMMANTAESLDSGVSNGMAFSYWSSASFPAFGSWSFASKPASTIATTFLGYNQPLCSINQASDYSGLWPVSPCDLFANSASNHGHVGMLPDIWITSSSVVAGDTAPLTGTANQFVAIAPGILVPWNTGAFSLS